MTQTAAFWEDIEPILRELYLDSVVKTALDRYEILTLFRMRESTFTV